MVARVLAIDFGLKRFGLAVSDALGITAQGLPSLERKRLEKDLEHIGKLVEEYSPERIILGNPLDHAGNETRMSRRVAEFADKLRRRLKCPVELWDERFTSVEAERVLRASGVSIQKRKRAVDRVAAVLLLQNYLDTRANAGPPRPDSGANE